MIWRTSFPFVSTVLGFGTLIGLGTAATAQTSSVEGAPSWTTSLLQQYGLAGLVIFVLAGVVWVLYQALTKSNDSRLSEREVMIRSLTDNTAAIRENAKATMDRNSVTKELADAIAKQAGQFEMFVQKVDMQNTSVRESLNTQSQVFGEMAQAMRTTTAGMQDVRSSLDRLTTHVTNRLSN